MDWCRCLHASKNHLRFARFYAYHSSSDNSYDFFNCAEYGHMWKMLHLFVLCFPFLLCVFSVNAEATKSGTSFMRIFFCASSETIGYDVCCETCHI